MRKILILFAHPQLDRSVANGRMLEVVRDLPGVTLIDLYAEYPRFEIDIDREQARLVEHDVIVFQHPLYWYSTPSILKEWQDLVLEYGFAYGSEGHALEGKLFFSVITTGGGPDAYSHEGYQHYPVHELLRPTEQTARLCGMRYLPPFVLYAAGHAVEEDRLEPHTRDYVRLLEAIRDDRFDVHTARRRDALPADIGTLIRGGG